ncbi:oligosaccharide flippase family protein [Tolypothrix sp. FACHB-123]|uniref:oligosaccharide flippase family protein n=1 Tax=Tolypothrix sp. FACHB-123 TaxID=2692868 RepID=UPI001689FD18|nr:oligosaccharide flippase family protein [Tolypothrix sp. FACHB-123]MBD2353381.1 oligosaccharide flippase family protein [Tolypothrix sp. FACHB-123]
MSNSLLKNGFYNAAAGVVRIGLAVLTIPILIRLIGVEEYGLWTLTSAVVAMVALAEAGLSTTTTVFVSQDLAREDSVSLSQTLTVTIGAMLILATIAAIALWFGAQTLVSLFPKLGSEQRLAAVQVLQIAGVVVWAKLLQQIIVGIEQAYQRYGVMNLLITLQSVLSNLGLLVVAWLGGKSFALMQCQAFLSIGALIAHIWLGWSLTANIKPRLLWNKAKGLNILHYSLMTWFASIGSVLFSQVDRLLVGYLLDTEILGVYAAITNITIQINTFSALTIQPLIPSVSSLFAEGSQNALSKLRTSIQQALLINVVTAFGLGVILITIAPLILQLMLPSTFNKEYIVVFQISALIYLLYSINAVGYYVLFALNLVLFNVFIVISSGLLSLILIFILSIKYGLLGAIIGNSGYLITIILSVYASRKIGLSYRKLLDLTLVPFIWLFIGAIIGFIIPLLINIRILIVSIECIFLLAWFKFIQYPKLRIN